MLLSVSIIKLLWESLWLSPTRSWM